MSSVSTAYSAPSLAQIQREENLSKLRVQEFRMIFWVKKSTLQVAGSSQEQESIDAKLQSIYLDQVGPLIQLIQQYDSLFSHDYLPPLLHAMTRLAPTRHYESVECYYYSLPQIPPNEVARLHHWETVPIGLRPNHMTYPVMRFHSFPKGSPGLVYLHETRFSPQHPSPPNPISLSHTFFAPTRMPFLQPR